MHAIAYGGSFHQYLCCDAAIQKQIDASTKSLLHNQLADAFSSEGDAPTTLAQVGAHRFHAGNPEQALTPLFRALLLGRDRFSVRQAIEVARLTYRAAEAHGDRANRAWQLAALVMAQSQWRQGKTSKARHIDEVLSSRKMDERLHLRVWSDRLHRAHLDDPRLPKEIEQIDKILETLSLPERARLLVARAHIRTGLLDRWGTHADLLDALACRPHPDVQCQAHLLRVRLLDVIDPMSAWHEALRCIEMARTQGLIGAEVLAWGLAGLHMSRIGHGQEALARIQAGIGRLESHGDLRLAAEARLHQGRILEEMGRWEDAKKAWSTNKDILPGAATLALRGRDLIAIHSLLRGDPQGAEDLATDNLPTPAIRHIWSIIRASISVHRGAQPMLPGPEALDQTAAVGRYGIAIGIHLAQALASRGNHALSKLISERISQACREQTLSETSVRKWIDRYPSISAT